MSRIGKKPVTIPEGVTAELLDAHTLQVKGAKGMLTEHFHPNMQISIENGEILVARSSDEKQDRSLHGLTRSLIQNMGDGVTTGYVKELEINGVGYRAALQGKTLVLNVGFSHQINMDPPEGITIEVPAQNKIIIKGIDKQMVGEFAAKVRGKKPPEPYKGKGIKYVDEVIRRKEGKTGGAGKK